jgi:acylphosphatase
MRDVMYAGIVVVVAAATTSPSAGATWHDGAARPPQPSGIIQAQAVPKATSAVTVVRAVTVVISGKVQGVGFRDWVVRRAKALKVRGWVENAPVGTVHALFGGSDAAVTAMLAACHQGPSGASVRDVAVSSADVADVPADFKRRN